MLLPLQSQLLVNLICYPGRFSQLDFFKWTGMVGMGFSFFHQRNREKWKILPKNMEKTEIHRSILEHRKSSGPKYRIPFRHSDLKYK